MHFHDGCPGRDLLDVFVVGDEGAPLLPLRVRQTVPDSGQQTPPLKGNVVDPNRLCLDPDPGSHVHSDPDPAQDPKRIRTNSDPDPTKIYLIFLL